LGIGLFRSTIRPLVGWFGISHVVAPVTNHPGTDFSSN
jgi:hypothetical protein